LDEHSTSAAKGSESSDDPTRERLLAAAAEVFGEVGYDRAGVQEIAKRAGFTTGAIYGRFRGKADLLLAAIAAQSHDELADLFAAQGEQEVAKRADDIITALGSHLVVEEFDHGQGLLLEAFVAARREPEVARMLRELLEERARALTRLIDEAKAAGVIDPTLESFPIVRFCHAVGLGFLLIGALDLERPQPEPWEALIQRLVAAVAEHPDD
jgi:AcrR family transcriptional regulator